MQQVTQIDEKNTVMIFNLLDEVPSADVNLTR